MACRTAADTMLRSLEMNAFGGSPFWSSDCLFLDSNGNTRRSVLIAVEKETRRKELFARADFQAARVVDVEELCGRYFPAGISIVSDRTCEHHLVSDRTSLLEVRDITAVLDAPQ